MKIKFFLFAVGALLLAGCASTETVSSPIAPAALAEVRTSETDNNNTRLNISVEHLAEPQRFHEGANQYIVWIVPQGSGDVLNVGSLKVGHDLRGTHQTTVPYENFRLFITPESSRVARAPSGPIVFDKFIQR